VSFDSGMLGIGGLGPQNFLGHAVQTKKNYKYCYKKIKFVSIQYFKITKWRCIQNEFEIKKSKLPRFRTCRPIVLWVQPWIAKGYRVVCRKLGVKGLQDFEGAPPIKGPAYDPGCIQDILWVL